MYPLYLCLNLCTSFTVVVIAMHHHRHYLSLPQVEDSRLLPVHLNFVRLVRLYPSGGTYLGFSFLLHKPLPSTSSSSEEKSRIVDLGPKWWVKPPPAAAANGGVGDNGAGDSSFHPPACGNEFLLQLPARDPLLRCVLSR